MQALETGGKFSDNPARPTLVPGERRAGREISVTTNIFPIKAMGNVKAFQYDVVIEPDVPPTVSRQLWEFVESKIQAMKPQDRVLLAYDGRRNAFSTVSLGEIGESVTVTVEYDKNAPTGTSGMLCTTL